MRITREDEHAGGAHVEPVHDQRIRVERLDLGVDAVLFVLTPTGYRQQAGGLADGDQGVVQVEQPKRRGFGGASHP